MNISFRDISKVKTGNRTLVTINIKSIEDINLFKEIMLKKICRCGYNYKEEVFHELLHSSRNLKYYCNHTVEKTEVIFYLEVKHKYEMKLIDKL